MARFEVPAEVTTKIQVFWDAAPGHSTDYAIPAVCMSEKLPSRLGAKHKECGQQN